MKNYNCRKPGNECPPETECCYEHDKKSGNKGNIGSCVALDSCDYSKGNPLNKPSKPCPHHVEGYGEGGESSGSCKNWKWAIILLIFVTLIFAFGFLWISIQYKKLVS